MIKDRDIVIVGIQAWDIEIGSNCKNIALEFSKHNRVLYVNSPLDRMTALKDKNSGKTKKRLEIIKGKDSGIFEIQDNLWEFYPKTLIEPVNRVPVNRIFDFFNKINSKRFSKEIIRATKALGFTNFILFNDSSMFLGNYLKDYLEFDSYIYYIRDNLVNSPYPYWNTHGKRIESSVISKADVVVTNSTYYSEYAQAYNKHSYMVGQGCDISIFDDEKNKIDVAPELKTIKNKGKVIGYVGLIAKIRLDIELLKHIATKKENWQIVLVGPEDDAFKASDLHQIKNIHFLGSMPSERLPEFIKGFDVCINPQILNITTVGNYPRKIDEYLAMGKPVVATKTKAMEYFKKHTYLCENNDEYIKNITLALNEDNPKLQKERRNFAKEHSWENNVLEISRALERSKK